MKIAAQAIIAAPIKKKDLLPPLPMMMYVSKQNGQTSKFLLRAVHTERFLNGLKRFLNGKYNMKVLYVK